MGNAKVEIVKRSKLKFVGKETGKYDHIIEAVKKLSGETAAVIKVPAGVDKRSWTMSVRQVVCNRYKGNKGKGAKFSIRSIDGNKIAIFKK